MENLYKIEGIKDIDFEDMKDSFAEIDASLEEEQALLEKKRQARQEKQVKKEENKVIPIVLKVKDDTEKSKTEIKETEVEVKVVIPKHIVKNLPSWKQVITDDHGNQHIVPKGFEITYKGNEVFLNAPFVVTDEKGKKHIHKGFLAEYLIKSIPTIYSTGVLYIYENGVYRPMKENEDEGIVKYLLTPQYSNMSTISDVSRQWKIDERINKFPAELNSNLHLLNLKNGVLDLSDNTNFVFKPEHSSEILSTVQVQANYNKDAKIDHFQKFLDSSVPDKKLQLLLQEMVGYCLTGYTKSKQMIFILNGIGDSGKSTFINTTIENLLNDNGKSHVPLQDLEGNPYNQAKLFGKFVNVFAELPDKPIKDIGYIKAASGNDWIPARRIYEAPFEFKNKAKFVFSCNTLPSNFSKDTTDAFYNRLTIIPFNQTITKKDPNLEDKLKEEIDGIFMWAIEGLQRLMANNWIFTTSKATDEIKEEYKKSNNPVMVFVEECCELSTYNETSRIKLYIAWENFCEQNGHIAGSQTKFNRTLEALYKGKVTKKQLSDSKRTKAWVGIRPLDFTEIE